jgi:hypothetical protein
MRVIAFIIDLQVVDKILRHLKGAKRREGDGVHHGDPSFKRCRELVVRPEAVGRG